jgi:type 1 glutamine amidotransferase
MVKGAREKFIAKRVYEFGMSYALRFGLVWRRARPHSARMKRLVQLACSLALAALPMILSDAATAADAPRKILFFSKSSGFEHDMIRQTNGQPSAAQKILAELGKKNNFEFTFTKDGSIFTPENLAKYDAFCFYTTGDLTTPGSDKNPPMPKEGKAAFLEAIHNGKGFVGIHSATDTFHSGAHGVDPYIKMIGGEFITHGAQQRAHQIVVDKNFPGLSAVPDDFAPEEEWYSLKNFSPDLHVLLVQDTGSMGKKAPYNRPDYPSTWAQQYGKGRAFYTSMGHRKDVWTNPVFQQVLVGGLKWAVGDAEADVTPNINKVTPEANVHQ